MPQPRLRIVSGRCAADVGSGRPVRLGGSPRQRLFAAARRNRRSAADTWRRGTRPRAAAAAALLIGLFGSSITFVQGRPSGRSTTGVRLMLNSTSRPSSDLWLIQSTFRTPVEYVVAKSSRTRKSRRQATIIISRPRSKTRISSVRVGHDTLFISASTAIRKSAKLGKFTSAVGNPPANQHQQPGSQYAMPVHQTRECPESLDSSTSRFGHPQEPTANTSASAAKSPAG